MATENKGGSDLRIYYGNTRVTLAHDDPRVPEILALVVRDALPDDVLAVEHYRLALRRIAALSGPGAVMAQAALDGWRKR